MHRIVIGCTIVILILSLPTQSLASSYGQGLYGSGLYGIGTAQPTSTPVPTSSSGSGGGSSNPGPTECTSPKPVGIPDLFQLNASFHEVTLYFSPVLQNVDRYVVSYGTTPAALQHAAQVILTSNGVISLQVRRLSANTTYYFKVRAGNGCQPGDWSNTLSIKTGQRRPTYRWISIPKAVQLKRTGSTKSVQPVPYVLGATTEQTGQVMERYEDLLPPKRSAPNPSGIWASLQFLIQKLLK